MIDTAARLLQLLSLLTARHTWGSEEIADRLAVTTRTVRRDIERLRELGYQVHAMPGPAGGYSLGAGAGLPPLLLDEDAAVAVAIGLRTVTSGAVSGMEEATVRAGAALEQVMPTRLRRRADALQAATVPLATGGPAIEPAMLATLALACRDSERLRFGYTDHHGRRSRRHAEPHRLVSTGRRWYLVARDVDRDDWRSFRLDRMGNPQPTGRRTTPADPPEAARFVAEAISSRPYRWQARALLQAPASVIGELVPATAAVVEAVDSETSLLIAGSDSLDAIAMHLALLEVPFTVLDPPELRERCANLAERLSAASRQ